MIRKYKVFFFFLDFPRVSIIEITDIMWVGVMQENSMEEIHASSYFSCAMVIKNLLNDSWR